MVCVRLLAATALLAMMAGPAAAQQAPAKLPDWSGLWEPEGTNTAISWLSVSPLERRRRMVVLGTTVSSV